MACKLIGLPEEELVKHFEASPAKAQLFREILTFAMDADNAEQLAALAGAAADAADTEVAAQLVEVQVFTRALEQIGPSHMMILRALNDISVRSETTLAGGRAMPALTTEQLAAQLPDLEPVITSLTSGLQTLGLIDRGSSRLNFDGTDRWVWTSTNVGQKFLERILAAKGFLATDAETRRPKTPHKKSVHKNVVLWVDGRQ